MHELANCRRIVNMVTQRLADFPGADVSEIAVDVGVMSGIDVTELVDLFPIVAKESRLQSAILVVNQLPIVYRCNNCATVIETQHPIEFCSKCSSSHLQFLSGNEFTLRDIQLTMAAT